MSLRTEIPGDGWDERPVAVVLAAHSEDVPGGGPASGILRSPV